MQSNSNLESARRFHNAQWVPNFNARHQMFARTLTQIRSNQTSEEAGNEQTLNCTRNESLSRINEEQVLAIAQYQGRAIQAQDPVRQAPTYQMTESPDVKSISSIEYARRFHDAQWDPNFNAMHQMFPRQVAEIRTNQMSDEARNEQPLNQMGNGSLSWPNEDRQITESQGVHGIDRNRVQEYQRGNHDQDQITRDLTAFESYMRGECSLSVLGENVAVQRSNLMYAGSDNEQNVSTVSVPTHIELQPARSGIDLSSQQEICGSAFDNEPTLQLPKVEVNTEPDHGFTPTKGTEPDDMNSLSSMVHHEESDQQCI
ncbi:uncharacterized protein [Amphiura filiformis]|uniref:uncharacterized protein isoform X2 n=1 Tax=Amphiura filiformis TaxID=82378 RepID=UPI003B21D9BC